MTSFLATAFFTLAVALSPARAALDLSRASVERLENDLTLIMLEDRTFPVVSIQTVYRTGAKDDPAGRLGLAHFFEHMAFRGSKNFPETGLVSEIYAAGGEWHGYTWIDLTTYFATTPKESLPLLLDIEADRMARLDLREDEVEAERGAVLSEMNGYANDPDSTLFDALMAAHFLTHPYRNNTIGYAGDVGAIRFDDLKAFYEQHYAPQNAVIALVGDFDRDAARKAVAKRFAKIRTATAARGPLTAELPRTGERRVALSLPSESKLFKIAYPAPAASSEDFPAFLVLQALIGESAGANFNQNDWGTPVGAASPLAGAAEAVRTWMIPTAEPYAFVVSGSTSPKADEAKIERRIQRAFDALARATVSDAALVAAKEKVAAALAFDLDTTEEAAHQLAYFAGIGALDRLLTLEADVASVSAEDVVAVTKRYIAANQRTVAWLEPGPARSSTSQLRAKEIAERLGAPDDSLPAEKPTVIALNKRPAVYFQRSSLSPTVAVKALVPGRFECDACVVDDIAFGETIIAATAPADKAEEAFKEIVIALKSAEELVIAPPSDDPVTRLEQVFVSFSTLAWDGRPAPKLSPFISTAAVSGDIETDQARAAVESHFPRRDPGFRIHFGKAPPAPSKDIEIIIDKPLAQAAVGYVAAAPAASQKAALATRIALYVLQHGYEGRLGKEAISRQGLAYYVDAQYRAGRSGGLVTLAAGVDADKVDAFRAVLKAEITRLKSEPPSDSEIAEAKRHLLGRKISAAQSNGEIVDALLRDYLAAGGPETPEAFASRLETIAREDVLSAAAALAAGAVVTVRVGGVD